MIGSLNISKVDTSSKASELDQTSYYLPKVFI